MLKQYSVSGAGRDRYQQTTQFQINNSFFVTFYPFNENIKKKCKYFSHPAARKTIELGRGRGKKGFL